jgi:hypothetical protein
MAVRSFPDAARWVVRQGRLTHTRVNNANALTPETLGPPSPQDFGWRRRGGGDERPTARKAVWLFSRGLDVGFVQRFVPIRDRGIDKKPSQRLEASIISL